MSGRLLFSLLPVAFAAIPYQKPIIPPTSAASAVQIQTPFEPNTESATSNANLIFNSLHSSMRQWGSSLQHNGMSFYPALVPEGTTLYHGTSKAERQTGAEWLAFEIEHAEVFARGGGGGGGGRRPGGPPGEGGQPGEGPPPHVLDDEYHEGPGGPGGPGGREPGYLHVYRTNRPMDRYLYVDGMSAGKSQLGTMDTQDYVLLNNHTGGGERERAEELCKLGEEWNVDGFIRMEAGFEIIHCNFTDGLDFVSHNKRPVQNEPEGYNDMGQFGWIRAVASRYDGIGGGRVQLDYSSMVSAYFYPLNLTNPDPDPLRNLPRLSSSTTEELARIKSDLKTIMTSSRLDHSITNWQEVVDMIVARYSDRLQFMATRPPLKTFLSEINNLLNLYINYDSPSIKTSIQTCTSHYIPTLNRHTSTPTDYLLHTTISTVTQKICTSLFRIREDLLEKTGGLPENDLSGPLESIHIIRELNEWLDWTTFKACGNCGYDHICYVAIWPFGSKEDHYNPSCKNATEIANGRGGGEGYWGGMHGGPGGGPGGRRPGKGGPPGNGSPPSLADL